MEDEKYLARTVKELADRLEAMRVAEYLELLQKPMRIMYLNFLAGIAKGLGIAVGATIVFAVLIEVLRRLILLNLPIISDFIIEIIRVIEFKQKSLP